LIFYPKHLYLILLKKKNMYFTKQEIDNETNRLYEKLSKVSWSIEDCKLYATLTLEINTLKKEQNAIIVAHSYQTPDIMYGIADFIGDSYGLALKAMETEASKVICCTVYFMAETIKLLNPNIDVLIPKKPSCSLADSITIKDIWKLKEENPNVPVVCYVNTSAKVKSEADICVTSSNALKIINSIESDKIIFIPDKHMGENLQKETDKKLILWNGACTVHEKFDYKIVDQLKKIYPNAKIVSHPECTKEVVERSDFSGGTTAMLNYVKNSQEKEFMILTECGIIERIKIETENKKFIGTCNICPYMKEIKLKDILKVLEEPKDDYYIEIEEIYKNRAKKSLEMMMKLS
jgi:quinolinate synthase